MYISKRLEDIIKTGCDAVDKGAEDEELDAWRNAASECLGSMVGSDMDMNRFMSEYERISKAER